MRRLVCSKCKKDNILDAKYCLHCGNKFTLKEISHAKRFTIVGILECIDEFNNIKDLSIITKNKIFRIISILLVLIVGFLNIYNNGNNIKLVKNDNYSIKHYKDMYYLIVDKEKTIVDLYVPKKVKYLELEIISNEDVLSSKKYELSDKIELDTNDEETYYLVKGIDGKDEVQEFKVKLIYEKEII